MSFNDEKLKWDNIIIQKKEKLVKDKKKIKKMKNLQKTSII